MQWKIFSIFFFNNRISNYINNDHNDHEDPDDTDGPDDPNEEPIDCLAYRLELSPSESSGTLNVDSDLDRWDFLYGDRWDQIRNAEGNESGSESVPSLIAFGSDSSGSLESVDELPSQPPFRITPDDDEFGENNFVGL